MGPRRPARSGRRVRVMAGRSAVDPARRTAFDVVLAVEVDDAYANLMLPRLLRERWVGGRNAEFATELNYGALRWSGVLDQVRTAGARRRIDSLDPPVPA